MRHEDLILCFGQKSTTFKGGFHSSPRLLFLRPNVVRITRRDMEILRVTGRCGSATELQLNCHREVNVLLKKVKRQWSFRVREARNGRPVEDKVGGDTDGGFLPCTFGT